MPDIYQTSIKGAERMAVSIAEAVEIVGISRSKLYGAMKDGALKSLKIGGRRVIRPSDLHSWLSSYERA